MDDKIYYSTDTYVCFNNEYSNLMLYLDNKFKSFIKHLNPKEYQIPALINEDVLRKCDYFSSFPHQITAVTKIKKDNYEDVLTTGKVKKQNLDSTIKYLTPAACLHIYPMLENNQNITDTVITTKARVYRFEEEFKELIRLWDFTVREIVYIGSEKYVESMLDSIKQKALNFAKEITNRAILVRSADHFYPSSKNSIKAKVQEANSLKFELNIPIKDEQISVASFNFHGLHFSKAFNFDRNGEIVTACAGFGLERWIAVCSEHKYRI